MSFSQKIINIIEARRENWKKTRPGDLGRFWRDGGDELLFQLPIKTGSLVIDGGGYKGDWTYKLIALYGCKSFIFEPVPQYALYCKNRFKKNALVTVHNVALGGSKRKTNFSLIDNGTSEFRSELDSENKIEVNVIDVATIFQHIEDKRVACFELNIEGGEYEVLERMIETNNIDLCDSLLIQFHQQPEGYLERYKKIIEALHRTHIQIFCYEMVWEKWVHKSLIDKLDV